jgi:uncharacterized membrane protein
VFDATLVFPLVSGVVAALGIPLWVGMVPPNRFYGVRTAATLADESLWYAVNRAAGRDMVIVGGVTFLLAVALPELGLGGTAYALLMALVLVAGAAFITAVGLARVRRL